MIQLITALIALLNGQKEIRVERGINGDLTIKVVNVRGRNSNER